MCSRHHLEIGVPIHTHCTDCGASIQHHWAALTLDGSVRDLVIPWVDAYRRCALKDHLKFSVCLVGMANLGAYPDTTSK